MVKYKLSIVIATLGGATLYDVVKRIANWNYMPIEIILVIPEDVEFDDSNYYEHKNVIIIRSKIRGQVQQRLKGFKFSTGDLVAQMDDDIILSHDSLTNLVKKIIDLSFGHALSPIYLSKNNSTSIHKFDIGLLGFIKNIYYKVVYNSNWGIYRMGTITTTGHGFGVDPIYINKTLFETDFLPGGVVISFKQDLITDNYFQFKGKAYCEDVINSILRKKRNIKQFFYTKSICLIDLPISETSYSFFEIKNIYKIRSHINLLLKKKKYYLNIYIIILFTRAVFTSVKKFLYNEN